jgi:hypothetical protein
MRAPVTTIFAATLSLAFGATGASAQALDHATQRLEIHGDAPAGCVANSARASKQVGATYQDNGPTGGVVVFPNLVDETTATSRESSIELALPVVCNTSHRITVRSYNGGLVRLGANAARSGSGGFSEMQTYDVALQWQQQTVQLGTQNASAAISFDQPAKGDIIVDIAVPRGTNPLVAGTYTDAVVVEIRPAN